MTTSMRVGFIGFGEVASTFSAAMRARKIDISAYDVIETKVTAAGVTYRPLPELVDKADYLLSTVVTRAAKAAAASCLPYLKPAHTYVDLNSTSPRIKRELDAILHPSGCRFVEGAILGAIGISGAATRILTGGSYGREAAETLTNLGLRVSFYSSEIGKASAFKMLRSIFSKGLEALILELLIAGRRAGIEKDLWSDVSEFMCSNSFESVAENWLRSHAVAYDRRYQEMVQVRETMREMHLNALMTIATESFFDRSRALGLDQAFPVKPSSMDEVVAFMERKLR